MLLVRSLDPAAICEYLSVIVPRSLLIIVVNFNFASRTCRMSNSLRIPTSPVPFGALALSARSGPWYPATKRLSSDAAAVPFPSAQRHHSPNYHRGFRLGSVSTQAISKLGSHLVCHYESSRTHGRSFNSQSNSRNGNNVSPQVRSEFRSLFRNSTTISWLYRQVLKW